MSISISNVNERQILFLISLVTYWTRTFLEFIAWLLTDLLLSLAPPGGQNLVVVPRGVGSGIVLSSLHHSSLPFPSSSHVSQFSSSFLVVPIPVCSIFFWSELQYTLFKLVIEVDTSNLFHFSLNILILLIFPVRASLQERIRFLTLTAVVWPKAKVSRCCYNFCTTDRVLDFIVYIGIFTVIELDSYISGA